MATRVMSEFTAVVSGRMDASLPEMANICWQAPGAHIASNRHMNGATVCFTNEELCYRDALKIVESARAENRLAEALCFVRRGRLATEWQRYLVHQKAFERATRARKRWCWGL